MEQDIILKHMFPLTLQPPRYLESLLVCLVDKGCALYETAVRRNAYPSLRPLMPLTLAPPLIPSSLLFLLLWEVFCCPGPPPGPLSGGGGLRRAGRPAGTGCNTNPFPAWGLGVY